MQGGEVKRPFLVTFFFSLLRFLSRNNLYTPCLHNNSTYISSSVHIYLFLVCNNNNHTIMLMIIREYLEIFTHRHQLPPSLDFCIKTLAIYYILLLYFHYIQSNLSECVLRLCLVHAWNVLKFIIKMNKFNLECTRRKCIVICIRIPSKEAETWTWNQKS